MPTFHSWHFLFNTSLFHSETLSVTHHWHTFRNMPKRLTLITKIKIWP